MMPAAYLLTFWMTLAAEPDGVDLASAEGQVGRAVLEKVRPYLVRIETTSETGTPPRWQSGVWLGTSDEVLTSLWGLERSPAALVVRGTGEVAVAGKILGRDHRRGIALLGLAGPLKMEPNAEPLQSVPRPEIRAGMWAWSVGNLWPDAPALSFGMISAVDRVWGLALQTDAKTSPTNYGGPLVDRRGRVVGLIAPLDPVGRAGAVSPTIYDSGVGFAVPLADILPTLPQLRQGDIHRGVSGLSLAGTDPILGPAVIGSIAWRSPAEEAGLMVGDRIVQVDGVPVGRGGDFLRAMGAKAAGESIGVSLQRQDDTRPAKLTLLSTLPMYRWPATGLITRSEGNRLQVQGTLAGSPAAQQGITAGETITRAGQQPVRSPADLRRVLDRRAIGERVAVEITSRGKARVVELPIVEGMKELPPAITQPNPPPTPLESKFEWAESAGIKHWLRPPTPKEGTSRMGLILFFDGWAALRGKEMADAWGPSADRHQLLLVGMEPAHPDRWSLEDLSRGSRLVQSLLLTHPLDADRVVVHGSAGSAAIAQQWVWAEPGRARGLIIVGKGAPPQAMMTPVNRLALALFEVAAPQDASGRRNRTRQRWESAGYPVVGSELLGSRYLSSEQIDQVARWSELLAGLH